MYKNWYQFLKKCDFRFISELTSYKLASLVMIQLAYGAFHIGHDVGNILQKVR